MKHTILLANPKPQSISRMVVDTYAEAVRAKGHTAQIRDLYAMGFDPCLRAEEIPSPEGFTPGADVVQERAAIDKTDVFVFVYPLWFNAPPAILKGYIDRVFGMGFGFGPRHGGGNEPLLTGAKLISFSLSGAPLFWVQRTGAWEAIHNLFDEHIASVCGFTVLDHIHIGDIVPDLSASAIQNVKDTVSAAVQKHI